MYIFHALLMCSYTELLIKSNASMGLISLQCKVQTDRIIMDIYSVFGLFLKVLGMFRGGVLGSVPFLYI